jgi:hypothetical protein
MERQSLDLARQGSVVDEGAPDNFARWLDAACRTTMPGLDADPAQSHGGGGASVIFRVHAKVASTISSQSDGLLEHNSGRAVGYLNDGRTLWQFTQHKSETRKIIKYNYENYLAWFGMTFPYSVSMPLEREKRTVSGRRKKETSAMVVSAGTSARSTGQRGRSLI